MCGCSAPPAREWKPHSPPLRHFQVCVEFFEGPHKLACRFWPDSAHRLGQLELSEMTHCSP